MQIVWEGNWVSPNGHATVARNIVRGLVRLGADVKLKTTEAYSTLQYASFLDADLLALASKADAPPEEMIRIIHRVPTDFQRGPERLTVGVIYTEATDMPREWVQRINSEVDTLVLPSEQAARSAHGAGVIRPIWVVPQGVDVETFRPMAKGEVDVFDFPGFRFLSVFEWVPRKGYDALLRAYWREFSKRDEVCLVIKTRYFGPRTAATEIGNLYQRYFAVGSTKRNGNKRGNALVHGRGQQRRRSVGNRWQTSSFGLRFAPGNKAPIYLYDGLLSDSDLARLYRHCSAFVLPTRGEGIGLPLMEAAATGLPIVVTGWGGQMDYLRQEDVYIVSYKLQPVPKKMQVKWQSLQGYWAEPSILSLRRKMRGVYASRGEIRPMALRQRLHVTSHWNWDVCVRDLLGYLEAAVGQKLSN
ncbi:glycosyltransferase family 4 protein [Alicyclobacillus mengziensis]|uniref:Glycosyltransferase family 4 protein n=1 Tax=Alicyclobacillus mengziensis TaxID=2931921 RepID=A0A9X7VYK5_9BACL|nr:glycosyltransferase family 4 protein [Alicyclobacillus mengziensis]QSO47140.1 glycosyltransferase family 4 protein [Alicyclobacillus mengziensis]